jgi:PII interaction protein X
LQLTFCIRNFLLFFALIFDFSHKKSQRDLMSNPITPGAAQDRMSNTETYIDHPTFGLLFRVSLIEENRELFATLYAQRLFFLVTTGAAGIQFEPIGRTDARILVEGRIRELRRTGQQEALSKLQAAYKQTFQ